jgi:carbonic anhydrase
MLSRRSLIGAAGAAAVAACPLCRSAFAAESAHWSYADAERWGDLSPEFGACGLGSEQSPIDLSDPIPSALGDVSIDWRPASGTVVNNGHTIQVNPAAGGAAEIAGTRYEMLQFHFHHPSEHTVAGVHRAMEAHFVHRAATGGLAVLGVFLVPGAESATLAKVWEKMPAGHGEAVLEGSLDLAHLLPAGRAYYRYAGSLTTPPCSETVLWTVFAEPVEVSDAQIAAFAALYPMNARPVQSLNRRFLL